MCGGGGESGLVYVCVCVGGGPSVGKRSGLLCVWEGGYLANVMTDQFLYFEAGEQLTYIHIVSLTQGVTTECEDV